jgi:hypothetical protein
MASSENDVFVCDKCKGSFTSLGYYERHKAKNKCFWRATAYSRVPCPLCSSTFNNDASAERHVRRAHGIFKRKRGKGESGEGDDVECVALKRGKTDERDVDSPALPPSSQLPPHLARLLPSSEQQEGVYGGGGKEEEEEEEGRGKMRMAEEMTTAFSPAHFPVRRVRTFPRATRRREIIDEVTRAQTSQLRAAATEIRRRKAASYSSERLTPASSNGIGISSRMIFTSQTPHTFTFRDDWRGSSGAVWRSIGV